MNNNYNVVWVCFFFFLDVRLISSQDFLFDYLQAHDFLSVSLTCSSIRNNVIPKIESNFTFRYLFLYTIYLIHMVQFHRIPQGKNVTTFSPQKAIVFAYSHIPPQVTHLVLLWKEDLLIQIMSKIFNLKLPIILIHRTFSPVDKLPPTLIHLKTGNNFNLPVNKLPPKLKSLTTGYKFNQPVNNLPPTLTHLTTGDEFNQPVDNLPPTLTHLTTGDNFNQPVDNLPHSLTHLTTGCFFNQPVDNLPPTLTHLTTGSYFNQPVDNLPPTLTHLTTGDYFNQPVDKLPPTLIHERINFWNFALQQFVNYKLIMK
jgi:FNIP Repeat